MTMDSPAQPGAIQDAQYRFPYHYLARIERGEFRFHEVLGWGHEYLSYLTRVADILADRKWASLLDVGCGDGRLIAMLNERFPDRSLVGLDYSERAIALARAMGPESRFVVADVTKPDLFEEKFDCATCIETIEHIEPGFLPEFVAGIRQHLKADAGLIVTVPSTNLPLTKKHYQHFTPELLTSTLSGPFEVERIEHLNGLSPVLSALRSLITNRLYTVTSPAVLTAFYRFYVRNYLRSDAKRGGRLLAICRAR